MENRIVSFAKQGLQYDTRRKGHGVVESRFFIQSSMFRTRTNQVDNFHIIRVKGDQSASVITKL